MSKWILVERTKNGILITFGFKRWVGFGVVYGKRELTVDSAHDV